MPVLGRLKRSFARGFAKGRARVQRRLASQICHGPARVRLAEHEVMAVILARDAGYFIERCLQHHFALGVRHILVIDNGSQDQTVQICQGFDRVSVVKNLLSAKEHESALRSSIGQRIAKGGWLLFVDSDELVELPCPLDKLTQACLKTGDTAVLGQMLERFSPVQSLQHLSYDQAILAMDHYSLAQVQSIDYYHPSAVDFHWYVKNNICTPRMGRLKRGGMRHAVFGEDPVLTKHSLVRNLPHITPMAHPHAASGVQVANISLLLHHYKFAGDWLARDRQSVESAYWDHGQDAIRLKIAEKGSCVDLSGGWRVPGAQKWAGLDPLYTAGFLDRPSALDLTAL